MLWKRIQKYGMVILGGVVLLMGFLFGRKSARDSQTRRELAKSQEAERLLLARQKQWRAIDELSQRKKVMLDPATVVDELNQLFRATES